MKKMIEYVIYSFYVTNKKYEYRTSKPTEVSAINFLASIFTISIMNFVLFAVLALAFYLKGYPKNLRMFIMLLAIVIPALSIYFFIKRRYDIDYIKSIFVKYEDKIRKSKAVLIMIETVSLVLALNFITIFLLIHVGRYINVGHW